MKKEYLKRILFVLCTLIGFGAFAQNTVKGKVIDKNNNIPLSGVTILIQGDKAGTISGFSGEFTISNAKAFPWTLVFSYMGSKTKTVVVNENTSSLFVDLEIDNSVLKDVVVTANKRAQSSQKVAMSITTLSPTKLARSGAEEFKDYAIGIPNIQFNPSGDGNSGRASSNVAIRGISGANTTAMYLDDTPLPTNINIRLMDVARVEVLRGPQGTLYGARNMGGAIKTITNQPSVKKTSGSLIANVSTVKEGGQDYSFQGIANVPLSSKLALRVGGFYDYQSGIFETKLNPLAVVQNKNPIVTVTDGTNSIDINTDGCDICLTKDKQNVGNVNQYGFTASLGYFPTDKISIIPKVITQNIKGGGYDFAESETGSFQSQGNWNQIRASGIPESFTDKWQFYSLTAKVETDYGSFISSTSYMNRNILEKEDSGEITLRLFSFWDQIWNPSAGKYNMWAYYMSREVQNKQFNQEVRFQSNFKNKFEFTAGAYYSKEDNTADWLAQENGKGYISYISAAQWGNYDEANRQNIKQTVPIYNYFGTDINSEVAVFCELYYKFTPKLKATVGLRYFDAKTTKDVYDWGYTVYDGVTVNPDGTPDYQSSKTVVQGTSKEKNVIPKFNLTYEISNNKLVYANAAKGFRLGGVNDIVNNYLSSGQLIELGFADGKQPANYESDYLWSYETGFKGAWANGKLITNVAVFYNDWQNLQQSKALNSGYSFISNVGNARSYGYEIELRAKIIKELDISGGYGYLNAELSEDVPTLGAQKGDEILNTAPNSANVSLDFNKELSNNKQLYATASYQYMDKRYGSFAPEIDVNKVYGSFSVVNARVGLQIKKYDLSIYGNNLTNTFANLGSPNAFSGDLTSRPRYTVNRPITFGFEGRYSF
ncbi:TonB-dependent receptor [Flavobacterium sp. ZT3R18]|uniref:TonB-dependent receptor n=1 Tax=Flavobacterium sp. ZT3R18 TaxID=2594429 RepID=UPI00117BB0FC|nr:TonB-dependent receptor [Flavobacterium sp. ZT3R18]TRX36843.1 TonB-dependent receptor [Flavobacterium sp. ZT3R18]